MTSGDIYLTIGSRADIRIGADCVIGRLSVHALAEGSRIDIGSEVGFAGSVSITTHERAAITIGSGCLIAEDTFISASDIHPVFDVSSGARINPAADIRIGDRVWLGARAMVMKGVSIGHDSVVGAGSIVTSAFGPQQPDRRQSGPADPLGRPLEPLNVAAPPGQRNRLVEAPVPGSHSRPGDLLVHTRPPFPPPSGSRSC